MKYLFYAGFVGLVGGWFLVILGIAEKTFFKKKETKGRIFRYCSSGFVIGVTLLLILNLYKTGVAYKKYIEVVELKKEQMETLSQIKAEQENFTRLLELAKSSADELGKILPEWAEELKNAGKRVDSGELEASNGEE